MKLYCVHILFKNDSVHSLSLARDVSSFPYFIRSGMREMLGFLTSNAVKNTETGAYQCIGHDEYLIHVFVNSENLAGALFTSGDYSSETALSVLKTLLDDFASRYSSDVWRKGNYIDDPKIEDYLRQYQQDP